MIDVNGVQYELEPIALDTNLHQLRGCYNAAGFY